MRERIPDVQLIAYEGGWGGPARHNIGEGRRPSAAPRTCWPSCAGASGLPSPAASCWQNRN